MGSAASGTITLEPMARLPGIVGMSAGPVEASQCAPHATNKSSRDDEQALHDAHLPAGMSAPSGAAHAVGSESAEWLGIVASYRDADLTGPVGILMRFPCLTRRTLGQVPHLRHPY